MKKILSLLLALLITMTLWGCGSQGSKVATDASDSQNNSNIKRLDMISLSQNIDEIAQYDLSNNKVFGAAYYVYQDGEEFEKCYGTTSLNSDTPITNSTIFRLASMTKPITTVAALILVERGMLSLDDTVDMYIPEFRYIKIIDSAGNESVPEKLPTVRNILNHTSGIASEPNKLQSMTASDKRTLDASIAFYIKNGLDFEPGSQQCYSGYSSFDVLTKIIEIASATEISYFIQKEIFEPCGMLDTTFMPTSEQQERMVDMHNRTSNGENAVSQIPAGYVFEDFPTTHYLGGAGLVSTLSDYSKFAKMLLNKGKTDTQTILNEETFNLLCTPQVSDSIMPNSERWGLGVRVITEDSYPYLPVGSFGWSGAYGTHFWIDPENKIFAVYMKNSKIDGGAANESAVNFEKAVYSSFATE